MIPTPPETDNAFIWAFCALIVAILTGLGFWWRWITKNYESIWEENKKQSRMNAVATLTVAESLTGVEKTLLAHDYTTSGIDASTTDEEKCKLMAEKYERLHADLCKRNELLHRVAEDLKK